MNVIYGSRCVVCGRRRATTEGGLCEVCREALTPREEARCPRCGVRLGPHVIVEGRCSYCRSRRIGVASTSAVFSYQGVVRQQIHAAKFERQWAICRRLARVFARHLTREHVPADADLVVSVPMFWLDRRLRGLHLAGALGRALAERLSLDYDTHVLRQLRPSRRQFRLTSAERFRNVRGLFATRNGVDLAKRTVLLVDDVMTTGATASECARVLRRAGAKTIHAAVLARTEPPSD